MASNFPDYSVPQPDLIATTTQYDDFHTRLASAGSAADCLAIVADWESLVCEFKEWASVTSIRSQQDTPNASDQAAKDELDPPFRRAMEEELALGCGNLPLFCNPLRVRVFLPLSVHPAIP